MVISCPHCFFGLPCLQINKQRRGLATFATRGIDWKLDNGPVRRVIQAPSCLNGIIVPMVSLQWGAECREMVLLGTTHSSAVPPSALAGRPPAGGPSPRRTPPTTNRPAESSGKPPTAIFPSPSPLLLYLRFCTTFQLHKRWQPRRTSSPRPSPPLPLSEQIRDDNSKTDKATCRWMFAATKGNRQDGSSRALPIQTGGC